MAEEGASSKVSVVIKPTSGGEKLTIDTLSLTATVAELKEEVAKHVSMPASEQRLIYKGQVIKDEKCLTDYGYESGHVVHLVKGRSQSSQPAATAGTPAGVGTTAPAAATPGSTQPTANPLGDMGGMGGFGMPPMGSNPQQMQDYMSQMLNSPMMQGVLNNPELLRSVFQNNPAIRELMERNPEFAQLMNNPQLLRESLQMAANPSLLREQMRNSDRVMSNLEAHPEGFNMLRRMYENIQEPLMNVGEQGAGANPFAALLQGSGGAAVAGGGAAGAGGGTTPNGNATTSPSGAPNTAPLPNPWASSGGGANDGSVGAAGANPAAPAAGFPGFGGLGGMPDLSSLGLPAGLGAGAGMGAMSPDQMSSLMSSPQFQRTMDQLLATPGMMESMINTHPQLRAMADANPQLRSTLNNPELVRSMMAPENLTALMQMQQAMQHLQGTPLGEMMGGAQSAMMGGPAPSANQLGGGAGGGDMAAQMLAALQGMGAPLPGMGAASAPVANPEAAFAAQLQQLQDMGFYDQAENIRALQATGGNVNAAVERLLSGI